LTIGKKTDFTVYPDSIKPNPDKPEITNYMHQNTKKFQYPNLK